MAAAQTAEGMSPRLLRVAELARQDPTKRFNSLAHLIDEDALSRAFHRLRADAAVGVDEVTKEQYGRDLEANLRDLHARMKAGRYRHQPLRRVHIPKAPGRTRPISISSTEDKVVQGAVRDVLEAIYEQDFLPCSMGFRPKRSAHDAVRALNRIAWAGETNWILEADIQSFFDSVDRKALMEMLGERVADGSLLRLVGKCLHVGVLEGAEYSEPEGGTAQGSVLSPLLGNVYLHYVLDVWFEREVRPRMRGAAQLIRYADDFVIGFARKDDAERVMAVLGPRMQRYGLTLHPDKTRLLPFHRPDRGPKDGPMNPATFDFLGFTLYWRKARERGWAVGIKTRSARLRRAIASVTDYCRRHRHLPVKEQHRGLCQRLNGHMNYFGVNGNVSSLEQLLQWTRRAWFKWLNRRSQRASKTWEEFGQMLVRFPLPRATVRVQVWARTT